MHHTPLVQKNTFSGLLKLYELATFLDRKAQLHYSLLLLLMTITIFNLFHFLYNVLSLSLEK